MSNYQKNQSRQTGFFWAPDLTETWSGIIFSPSLKNFHDPDSTIFSAEKIRLRLSSLHESQAVGFLLAQQKRHPKVLFCFVGEGRLELPWITPLVPKTSAATNYATRPFITLYTILIEK